MIKKYNIALIPTSKHLEFIEISKKFTEIAHEYCLGSSSIPHVTLRQFHIDETQIEKVWEEVSHDFVEPINLSFKDFSCLTFDDEIFWVSLMPNQRAHLFTLHETVSNRMKLSVNKTFDPHMTLINTQDKCYIDKARIIENSFTAINDDFVLALGACDSVGQITEVIYRLSDVFESVSKR